MSLLTVTCKVHVGSDTRLRVPVNKQLSLPKPSLGVLSRFGQFQLLSSSRARQDERFESLCQQLEGLIKALCLLTDNFLEN